MSITDWPVDERPREKLMRHGSHALSDAELLAIFLRVGVTGASAVDLAQQLIAHFGSLARLFSASIHELEPIKGMGRAKYAQLQAVFEMSRRALADTTSQHNALHHIDALKTYLQLQLKQLPHERCIALYLDTQLHMIHSETLADGAPEGLQLSVRQLARHGLSLHAYAIILAHNHPNGDTQPSADDVRSTLQLQAQLAPLGLHLVDHFIISDGKPAYSMAENGLLAPTSN